MTLSASLRVGCFAAGADMAEDLLNLKVLSCITTSQFAERMLYSILTERHYRKYIDQLRARVDEARTAMLHSMKSVGMQVFAEPASGNFVRARFAHIEDATSLSDTAQSERVMLARVQCSVRISSPYRTCASMSPSITIRGCPSCYRGSRGAHRSALDCKAEPSRLQFRGAAAR